MKGHSAAANAAFCHSKFNSAHISTVGIDVTPDSVDKKRWTSGMVPIFDVNWIIIDQNIKEHRYVIRS